MRKWALSACCAVLIIGGCSGPTATDIPEDGEQAEQTENLEMEALLVSKGISQADGAEEPAEGLVAESELLTSVTIKQLDGTAVEWTGHAVTNEAIGYSIYLLPGFRAEINDDSGTLTISTSNGSAEAMLEALPPRADLQAAADELRNTLLQLDENLLEITDYKRLEFWSDARIYRAYMGEERLTAILKSVHDIPFRITVSEQTDADVLLLFMAMIQSIQTDNLSALTEPREELVRELVAQAYLQQRTLLRAFQADLTPEDETDDEGNDTAKQNTAQPDATDEADDEADDAESAKQADFVTSDSESIAEAKDTDSPEHAAPSTSTTSLDFTAYFIVGSSLSDILHTKDSVAAYLETIYTPSTAEEIIKQLALRETASGLVSDWEQPEALLHWEQASFTLISKAEDTIRYLVRIPGAEGVYELREIVLLKLNTGWRLQTPLELSARVVPQDTPNS